MSPFNCPHSGGLHDYRHDEKDGAEGGTFGSGMQPGVNIGKAVKTESPDKIEEKAYSYEYIACCVQCPH
jgi:hypothetical protein